MTVQYQSIVVLCRNNCSRPLWPCPMPLKVPHCTMRLTLEGETSGSFFFCVYGRRSINKNCLCESWWLQHIKKKSMSKILHCILPGVLNTKKPPDSAYDYTRDKRTLSFRIQFERYGIALYYYEEFLLRHPWGLYSDSFARCQCGLQHRPTEWEHSAPQNRLRSDHNTSLSFLTVIYYCIAALWLLPLA